MPLTIRVESIRKHGIEVQTDGMMFPQKTILNQNPDFMQKTILTGLGLKSFNILAKTGRDINSMVGAYTLNYSRQEYVDRLISGASSALSIGFSFAVGGPLLGMANIAMQTMNAATDLFYNHISTRNDNYGISNYRSVVGTTRKPNGRIGV